MKLSINVLSLLCSCLSFAILISFGITYVKFLNINPIVATVVTDDSRSSNVLHVHTNDHCNIDQILLIDGGKRILLNNNHLHGNSAVIPFVINTGISEINIAIEYNCTMWWLHREGDTLVAHALRNE